MEHGNYNNVTVRVEVQSPDLNKVLQTGTGNIKIGGFENLSFLQINTSGTGDVTAQGTAEYVRLISMGTGDIRAFDFTSITCDVSQTGTGNIEVTCTQQLEGTLSGTGDLFYKGQPEVNVESTGIGKVIQR